MRLYLIRHGTTSRNLPGNQLIGQSIDEPLTKHGEDQAMLLGKRLAKEGIVFKEVYCSPYKRAVDTCKWACSYIDAPKPIIVDELREYSTGEATNKNRSEVITAEVFEAMNELGMHFNYVGGENLFAVENRMAKWLFEVMQKYKDTNENIAAFSHGTAIKCLLHYIMNFEHKLTWRISIDNTSMSVFDYKLDHWFVRRINDLAHLGGVE